MIYGFSENLLADKCSHEFKLFEIHFFSIYGESAQILEPNVRQELPHYS